MRIRLLLLSVFLVLATAFPVAAQEKESVYDRVMRTGTIRCGYMLWDIYLNKDPDTGKMGGIYYDYMEQLGKNLGLKIQWDQAETGNGDYIAALENDRFDIYCTVIIYNAQWARQVDFLSPFFYMSSAVFVREGDKRVDGHLEKLNDPAMTLTTFEGDIFEKISNREFPAAKKFQIPQMSTEADLFLSVATAKADATITETSAALKFMEKNPGKLRMVDIGGPFRALPASISIKGGEYRFQRMLEIATVEMMTSGTIESILKKHEKYPGTLLRVAKPFVTGNP